MSANPQIDDALRTGFSERVHLEAQQSRARLRDRVMLKPMESDDFAFDRLGATEAIEQTGRYQKVVFSDAKHSRRKISRRRFTLTLPIDSSDPRGTLLSPQSEYPRVVAKTMERVFDRIVVEAAFADVLTGRNFGTTVTFANDDGDTIDATAGLTYEKLLEMDRLFVDDEVGNDMPERMSLLISGDEVEDLMLETELVSGDFTRQFAIEKGQITRAMQYELVKFGGAVSNPILAVSGGTRDNIVMSDRAMCVGMSKEIDIKLQERPDLHETTQVEAVFELGAVRTEGKLIKKVQTTD